MKFYALTLLSLLVGASASVESMLRVDRDIPVDSKFGQALLEKATVIEHARSLANNNNQQGAFLYKYSIKYLGCSSIVQINGEEGNKNNQGSMLYNKHLVRFALCPSDSCSSCPNGGQYVVNMQEFINAYTEAKLNEKEAQCEAVRETCYCNGQYNDDRACEEACYAEKGLTDCIEYEGQEAFEVQRYLECGEMPNQNGNQNGNNYQYGDANGFYGQYYIGPYCSRKDGKSIHLGVFYDQGCVNHADVAVYANKNYGVELPYSKESMVTTNDCMSCLQQDQNQNQNNNNNNNQNQNNNNNNQNYEITELCQQSYQSAAKCEKNMDIYYPDSTGCNYISNILPRLESATRQINSASGVSGSNGGTASVVFAWLFAATTVMFGAYAYFLYRKIKRGTVNLSAQEGLSA